MQAGAGITGSRDVSGGLSGMARSPRPKRRRSTGPPAGTLESGTEFAGEHVNLQTTGGAQVHLIMRLCMLWCVYA